MTLTPDTKVYVRWYGQTLEGEVADGGGFMGMTPVRIPLDGHHPVALFFPQHVYGSPEEVLGNSHVIPQDEPKIPKNDIIQACDRQGIEAFKKAYWDDGRGHLRVDKLDEFYQLWRKTMTPIGFAEAIPAEAPASNRIVSDERMEVLKEQLKDRLDKLPDHQPTPKPASPKPSKKMLRSTGQQVFRDSTQLALFD